MDAIHQAFHHYFKNADLHLPDPIPAKGKIEKEGWSVTYICEGSVLEFYADHRMTNPRHVIISKSGEVEEQEGIQTALVLKEDTPEGWAQASTEMDAHNKKVTQNLRDKGLMD